MSPAPFPAVPLAELKRKARYSMVGGPFGSKLVQRDYEGDGVPVIRGANLPSDQRFSFNDFVFVSPAKAERDLRSNRAYPGDIIVTQRGTLGQVGLIPRDSPFEEFVLSQSQMKLTVDHEIADATFVYYALKSPVGQHEITSRALVAGVPHINLAIFGEVRVPLPPLPTQRKIASILSAYDDLIENNRRRIALLEEIAQRIFREWFVEFRFPGHAEATLAESPLGPIPQGWSLATVREIASCVRGRSYRGTDLVDAGGLPFINLKCVDRDGGFRPEGLKRYAGAYLPAQVVTSGDIVIAVTDMTQQRRIVARAARVPPLDDERGVISMDLVKVVPTDLIPSEYLYGLLRFSSFPDSVKQHANGANVLHLHPDRIGDFRFPRPPRWLMERYGQIAHAVYAERDVLAQGQEQLATSRELLLPRLVSGEIDVEDLAIATYEVAA